MADTANGEATPAATGSLRALGGDLRKTRAEGRAALLAAMDPGGELEDKRPPAEEAAPAAPAKPAAKPAPAPADDDDDADDLDEDAPADAETNRKLAALKRQEQRGREALARERAEFEREREATRQYQAKIDAFDKLAARAKYDPVAALQALGLTEEDYEVASKHLYAHSKAASADPKNREAVAAEQRARQLSEEVATARRELADLKKSIADEKAQAQVQRKLDKYFAKVSRAATPEATPLLAADLEAEPKRTTRKLQKIAAKMASKGLDLDDRGFPSPAAVVQKYEARRRARIEEMGFDVGAYRSKKTKDQAKAADKDRSAPTPSIGTRPTGAKAIRAATVAALEADQLD